MHLPNRVLHQFAREQEIPVDPDKNIFEHLHSLKAEGRFRNIDWSEIHQQSIATWNNWEENVEEVDFATETLGPRSTYMQWYFLHTRRYIGQDSGAISHMAGVAYMLEGLTIKEPTSNYVHAMHTGLQDIQNTARRRNQRCLTRREVQQTNYSQQGDNEASTSAAAGSAQRRRRRRRTQNTEEEDDIQAGENDN